MDRGYIKFWRKTLDNHSLCSDPYAFTIFMHFLARAEWRSGRKIWDGSKEVVLQAGQLTYGRKELSKTTGVSEEATRWAVKRLITTNTITIKTTTKFTIVTILNWDIYQQTDFETTTRNNHKEQPTNPQPTPTLKELKNTRSKELNPLVVEFLTYFNEKTKRKLTLNTARSKIIESRLASYSINQLKQAVDNFIKDDWEGRPKYTDVVYCIGIRDEVDNLEKWLNMKPKTNWIKP